MDKPKPKIKSIIQRFGLLKLDEIAEMFCFEKDTFMKKWHAGEPIIRDVQLRSLGKNYVADERHVWNVLERFKDSLELAVPVGAMKHRNIRKFQYIGKNKLQQRVKLRTRY